MNQLFRRASNHYRYSIILLRQMVRTDFKLRYQGSVLGYLWSLLRPLAIFMILYVVFVRFLKVGQNVPHFSVYLLLGIVMWNFFLEITSGSVASIVSRGDLIRKINFPKYVIVIATSFAALINVTINLGIILIFMIIDGVPFRMTLIGVPLLLVELYALALGLAFWLSSIYVKYRDVGYVWDVVMQGMFYATPILYPLTDPVPLGAQKLLLLNPVAQVIQDQRLLAISETTRTFGAVYGSEVMRVIPVLATLFILVSGALYFRKNSKYFAENV